MGQKSVVFVWGRLTLRPVGGPERKSLTGGIQEAHTRLLLGGLALGIQSNKRFEHASSLFDTDSAPS